MKKKIRGVARRKGLMEMNIPEEIFLDFTTATSACVLFMQRHLMPLSLQLM